MNKQNYTFHPDIEELNLLIVDEEGFPVDFSVLAEYIIPVEEDHE